MTTPTALGAPAVALLTRLPWAGPGIFDLPRPCRDTGSVTCAAVYDWTGNTELAHAATWLIGKPLAVVALLVLAVVLRWIAHRAIDRVVARAESGVLHGRLAEVRGRVEQPTSVSRRVQRARSLGSLLRSISTGVIYGVVFVMILAQVGVNVAPILASAGVLGLAIGFGAQSLVKDFLAGIAMMLEDQYGVGDSVDLGTTSGTVEAVGLRVTRLRDVNGTVWYVRNGEILQVGNQSQEWARTVLDVSVGYAEDLARVQTVLLEVVTDLRREPDYADKIVEDPEVWGVQSMDADGVSIRVALKTQPLAQWAVARALRERIKSRFDTEGIEIPFPQRVVWHRTDGVNPGDAGLIPGVPTPAPAGAGRAATEAAAEPGGSGARQDRR